MSWWKHALFDTCSIITLDKLLLERAGVVRHFPSTILALEETFTEDQLRAETKRRMRPRISEQPLPSRGEVAAVLSQANLSRSLAEVDTLIYATAVHKELAVITGDRQLGRAVRDAGLRVANMALVLRDLVRKGELERNECERLLLRLADRKDLILGTPTPTWGDLTRHRFPDR